MPPIAVGSEIFIIYKLRLAFSAGPLDATSNVFSNHRSLSRGTCWLPRLDYHGVFLNPVLSKSLFISFGVVMTSRRFSPSLQHVSAYIRHGCQTLESSFGMLGSVTSCVLTMH
jgi:hypothetical protein